MEYSLTTRYQILLEITNAVINKTSREDFFDALAAEFKKHFSCDRLSINLYDEQSQSLTYFTRAEGVAPEGISGLGERPLIKGSIAKMVIQSRQPVIIDNLLRYKDLFSIGQMVKAGLVSTMAFPLIIRNKILGTLHFSFKQRPDNLSRMSELLTDVTSQVAIAVDNLIAYNRLEDEKKHLEREKQYLISHSENYRPDRFFYTSAAMLEIMELVHRVAPTEAPVFITGETGTGKDFLARYIHHLSLRNDHMFIKVNCPAIPPSLFESELFGHAKGAFTGADTNRVGRFEMADKGTVFLDEVGELPASLQAKLLQVLQEKRFDRVGGSRPVETDFRVIAATNRDPEESIHSGQLRKDLYYRLNIIRIHMPPLRDRIDDVPVLLDNLTQGEAAMVNQKPPVYSREALDLLLAYDWPGNIRELKNLIKRMIILKPGARIQSADIEKMIRLDAPAGNTGPRTLPTLAEAERRSIEQALIECNGVIGGKNGAARLLDVPRSTLQYRMKKYNICPVRSVSIPS